MDLSRAKARTRKRPSRRRVGRGTGSRRGKTCGRGQDGARSRSGWSSRGMTGGNTPLWRRLPKRGFSNAPFKTEYSVVNVGELNRFPDGAVVTPDELRRAGLVKQMAGGGVKVLGGGELARALTVRANAFSQIESAGGTAERIPGPQPPVRNKMRVRQRGPSIVEEDGAGPFAATDGE
ncbi:MAG: 50S ribosomal protein L15 [Planctomycetota bacterium]